MEDLKLQTLDSALSSVEYLFILSHFDGVRLEFPKQLGHSLLSRSRSQETPVQPSTAGRPSLTEGSQPSPYVDRTYRSQAKITTTGKQVRVMKGRVWA